MNRMTRRVAAMVAAAVVMATTTVPVTAQTTERFDDVPAGHTFHADVAWLATSGITRGCNPPDNTRFCPDQPVTRGQMAAFLKRGLGLPTGEAEFSDIYGHTFEGDIASLADAGITRGCNPPANDRFCPDQPVTRGQMAAFLVRALSLPAGIGGFDDTVGHTFERDISALAEAGITRGCNPPANDRFCPDQPVTRGQMAAFLHRALQTVTGKPVEITTTGLPMATALDVYEVTLIAQGGTAPHVWNASGLPTGLEMRSDGTIQGVTPELGSFDVSVTAVGGYGQTATAVFELTVEARPQITTGDFHTCAIDAKGHAQCWGQNWFGQLGVPTATAYTSSVPVSVVSDDPFVAITAGAAFSCGIATTGRAWCWGYNPDGRLGDGSTGSSAVPVPVSWDVPFVAIDAGSEHACGIDAEGTALCWGHNGDGRLGDGSTGGSPVPVRVDTTAEFTSISAGLHTCGLTTDGEALCWGRNADGEFGNGTTDAGSSRPVSVSAPERLVEISAGGRSTCGLGASGSAWCWGWNQYGQIGGGDFAPSPDPVRVVDVNDFVDVDADGAVACGLDASGSAWCWGQGAAGTLGSAADSEVPVAFPTPGELDSVAAGSHACGLGAEGAWCWGQNGMGQLGDGSTDPSATPVPVTNLP